MPLLLAPAMAEEALTLTAIGIGTAFAVLLILLVTIALIRLFSIRVAPRFGWEGVPSAVAESEAPDPELRNRALAAAVAVTAMLESRAEPKQSSGEDNS